MQKITKNDIAEALNYKAWQRFFVNVQIYEKGPSPTCLMRQGLRAFLLIKMRPVNSYKPTDLIFYLNYGIVINSGTLLWQK